MPEAPTAKEGQSRSLYLPVREGNRVRWQLEEGPEAAPEADEQAHSGEQVNPSGGVVAPPKTLLVVDDDPVMRMLLKLGLRSPGFECLVAENGKAAQEIMETNHPDLILLDLLMPVMDGMSFLQWLRQTKKNQTPVLVFSNANDSKMTDEALTRGAHGVLYKPLHLKELKNSIQKLVPG